MALTPFFAKLAISGVRKYSCCINVNDPYVISAVRTPFGSFQGKLSSFTAVQLGSKALTAAVERSGISKDEIAEVVVGCLFIGGLGQAPARQVAIFSGLSSSVIASSINKLCASSLKAIISASQIILSNTQEVVAVGGIESLSNVPYILRRKNPKFGNIILNDLIFHDGLYDFMEQRNVTEFAEMTAKDYKIGRKEQDEYGVRSYTKSCAAQESGVFAAEIIPVEIKRKGQENEIMCEDEGIRKLDLSKYYDLKPEIGKDGTVTSGNSSTLNDGACMLILASGSFVLKKNLKPLARIMSFADGAVDHKQFCIAPAVAIPRALVRANVTIDDISVYEINETFAVTPIVNAKILKLDMDKVNPNGGAISIGHAFGATGARLVCHLVHTLQPGQLGCAAISHAGGGASAVIIEKL